MFCRKFKVISSLIAIILIAVAATTPASQEQRFTNLKVLPKNISSKALSHIMVDEFEDGLGVSCGFCHAEQKGSHRLDYASDVKLEKEIARLMMRMSIKLNKKYFQLRRPMIGESFEPRHWVVCLTITVVGWTLALLVLRNYRARVSYWV